MPSNDDEIIIRNGTWKQWLDYIVVIGGNDAGNYGQTGGIRIKGKRFVVAAAVVGLVIGLVVGSFF